MPAVLSPDSTYRYRLSREWTRPLSFDSDSRDLPEGPLVFCMLNPSTADADRNDPTINRCIGVAKRAGYSSLVVVNLFAYRTPEPKRLLKAFQQGVDVVGPENERHLAEAAATGRHMVCARGAEAPQSKGRAVAQAFLDAGATLSCLGVTQSGAPRHPLYVKNTQALVPFRF